MRRWRINHRPRARLTRTRIYRHLGNNPKLGVGFQNGNVSDDITDIDYVGQGIFINLVAKF